MLPQVYFGKKNFYKPGQSEKDQPIKLSLVAPPIIISHDVWQSAELEWNPRNPADIIDLGVQVAREWNNQSSKPEIVPFFNSGKPVLRFSKDIADNTAFKPIAYASIAQEGNEDYVLAEPPFILEINEYSDVAPRPHRFENSVRLWLAESTRNPANAYVVGNPVSYNEKRVVEVKRGSGVRHISEIVRISKVPIAIINAKDKEFATRLFKDKIHFLYSY